MKLINHTVYQVFLSILIWIIVILTFYGCEAADNSTQLNSTQLNSNSLTYLYENNELLWVSVQPSGVFSWEKLSSDYPLKSHDHDHQWAVLVMAWLL